MADILRQVPGSELIPRRWRPSVDRKARFGYTPVGPRCRTVRPMGKGDIRMMFAPSWPEFYSSKGRSYCAFRKTWTMTLILGIETSCDETAAAVVKDGRFILSNAVASQVDIHRRYGGIFPEVASRQHILSILPVIEEALFEADIDWGDLSAVAVTHGPGLAGSLLVGVNAAKGLAWGCGLPVVGINHIEAHIYANWLIEDTPPPEFPLICLVVSGGHSELILMTGHGQYQRLGGTLDDAAGEAFDKVGRLLELPYPGGPAIQEAARDGSSSAFKLPRAWLPGTYNFSFSGLKTAVLRIVQQHQINPTDQALSLIHI